MSTTIATSATVLIDVDAIRMALRFTSTEAIRQYITGILIETDGTLVATDGHALVAIRDAVQMLTSDDGALLYRSNRRVILSFPEKVKLPQKATTLRVDIPETLPDWDNRHTAALLATIEPEFGSALGAISVELSDGVNYPPLWRNLFPKKEQLEPAARVIVNPDLLARFTADCKKATGVIVTFAGNGNPMLVRINGRHNVAGLVMPMHGVATHTDDPIIPEWIRDDA